MRVLDRQHEGDALAQLALDGRDRRGGRVTGHRAGVAEAEVDVVVAVDVLEVGAAAPISTNSGKPPGPLDHPVHRHAVEQRALGPLVERHRTGMVRREASPARGPSSRPRRARSRVGGGGHSGRPPGAVDSARAGALARPVAFRPRSPPSCARSSSRFSAGRGAKRRRLPLGAGYRWGGSPPRGPNIDASIKDAVRLADDPGERTVGGRSPVLPSVPTGAGPLVRASRRSSGPIERLMVAG